MTTLQNVHTKLNSAERKNHTNKNKERTKNKECHASYASAYKEYPRAHQHSNEISTPKR